MNRYIILLRGINVGGKSIMKMSKLKDYLVKLGFSDVKTYIASGNVILSSSKKPDEIKTLIESTLPQHFDMTGDFVKALVLTENQIKSVIENKPKGFGEEPKKYYSDAIFLIDITAEQAMKVFTPKDGVDKIWKGKGVIYSQRLSAQRTKSRLNRIMSTAEYKSMTIRNWNTTTKLAELIEAKS